ncbi:MAG TPA: 1-acyl-sn-glycerol-3-phosphate acyltransferase [Geminicoccaceae bacterium]|nr:1-acyl-sn-glycerol-3-phosphate acyltransferase [Geminicoccaceae bacterium]
MSRTDADPTGRHIVDVLIEERAPTLFRRPLTRWLMRRLLYPYMGYREAKEALDRVQHLSGAGILDYAADEIAMEVRTLGASRLPAKGRVVIAVNHPTGLADGVALWRGLSPIREDLKILANGDALRIAPPLADVFIPVEWIKTKRNPAGSRRVLADVAAAFRDEAAVVFFPSGRLAYMHWRGLKERPWIPTVVTIARKFEAPILPLHIRARNSWQFYALSQVSHELRDVTLFHELLNKRGRRFDLTMGLPIDPSELPDDPSDAVSALQHHVEHELPRASRCHPRIQGTPRRRRFARLGAPSS